MNKLIIIVGLLTLNVLSCKDVEQGKLIKGKWKCIAWTSNGQAVNDLANVGFEFKEGTYEYVNHSLKQKGTYKVEGGNLYSTPENDLEIAVRIEKLTQDTLIFDMNRAGTSETMILVRE